MSSNGSVRNRRSMAFETFLSSFLLYVGYVNVGLQFCFILEVGDFAFLKLRQEFKGAGFDDIAIQPTAFSMVVRCIV